MQIKKELFRSITLSKTLYDYSSKTLKQNDRLENWITNKLNHTKFKQIFKDACQLKLSLFMKIHDTFHTFLLRFIATNYFIEQMQSSSFSIVINEEEEYEINDILNSRYHYDKLQYKIVWTSHSLNRAWYSTKNFQDHSKEILIDYHQKYSNKSKFELCFIVSIESITEHFYWL
jgi:hypothetical protein